ncbi:MAG: glycosyltransferase family 2 protein [Chloroflexi bacterium AL-W]|nr:glycosyltransferase family 2 protein [Chloroflexi bacterium AL-N1]NOK66959.1 glycosyltransferase family 2 protein [Chloroflexi bacterium AL-N10]NOK74749.1 glycosyltransferase family 2 protein [Chloroflexi bacterium AL-N5]NOK81561.1 glycosyltransferase family 2 protein [Chloroflexi bacterium AL-W]NOK89031.1 glycosyltransferase family 2 protein [Chloroflexi bacterium AL-N15]
MLHYDMKMLLSIIIPTWNGLRHLPTCLEALFSQLPAYAEIILVDNGSTDATASWCQTTYPEVRIISLQENRGFTGGITTGLRAAQGQYLLLLNDDAFVEPHCLDVLLETLEHNPHIGAAGGLLTFAHQPDLVASAGIRTRYDGVALDLWTGRTTQSLPPTPINIMGPSGAAALYRRELLEDVGLFEPTFFAYLEDVDLAWRAILRGWRSVVVPSARIRHVYSATSGQGSSFKQRLLGRNRWRAILRCWPTRLLQICLPLMITYDTLAMSYGLAYNQRAMVQGRLAVLRELSTIFEQRQAIQMRRIASVEAFARWLEPVPMPHTSLRDQQKLNAILQQR